MLEWTVLFAPELMRLYAVMGAPIRLREAVLRKGLHELPVLNAASASSSDAVFAPCHTPVPTDSQDDVFHKVLYHPLSNFKRGPAAADHQTL